MDPQIGVSIVIPVFNEQECLEELLHRLHDVCTSLKHPAEIILVDDGSRDRSPQIIKTFIDSPQFTVPLTLVMLNRNYGQHAAIMAGFERCRGDIIVTLDADLQNFPEDIPRLVETMEQGYDVVGSIRRNRSDPAFRKIASALVNRIVQKSTGIMMHDYGCMLRAYRHHIVEAMKQCPERSTFIPVLANSFARKTTEIEVQHQSRSQGESKYNAWKLINLQFDLLTAITTLPLRMLSVVGFILSILGMGFGFLIILFRILLGSEWAAEGVFTLFALLFFFVGAQFVGLGLLGEYIGRIYVDVRARPRFFVGNIDQNKAAKNVSLRNPVEVKLDP